MPTLLPSTGFWSGRAKAWSLFLLGAVFCLSLAPAPRLWAQDAKDAAKDDAPAASSAAASTAEPFHSRARPRDDARAE